MAENIDKSYLDWTLLKRVLQLANPFKKVFYGSIFLSITLALLSPLRPYLVEYTVDHFFTSNKFELLRLAALGLIGLLLIETFLRYIFSYITAWLGANIIKNLRMTVFNHLIFARLKYFDETPIGTSVTRTISDIEAINDTFSEGLITIFADILTILVVGIYMFYKDWQLASLSLLGLPLLLWVTRWFQEGVKKSFQQERTQVGKMNAFLQEHITGMRIIQLFNVEKKEMKKFEEINESLKEANVNGIWYYSLFFPAVEICVAIGVGFMIWMATDKIFHHQASVGTISAFIMYINMLFRPLRFIADKVNTIQRGIVCAERVFKLTDQNLEIENKGTLRPNPIQGAITFENVFFSYVENNSVLKNVSFHINTGETLAIVGATGSGKSSTINILGRFYEIQSGRILIDNIPISELDLSYWRQQMSVVLQDVFLFAGSVLDNITLYDKTISKEAVIEAAIAIGAHSFILELPGGYEYKVMERGATLSLGQRQLISFVRALVRNPKILILDEATSSIDSKTESVIQTAIDKLTKGRTSIVIAHRLSTIRNAHKIMVLDQGEILEIGNHEELIAKDGQYKKMYEMQFEKEEV